MTAAHSVPHLEIVPGLDQLAVARSWLRRVVNVYAPVRCDRMWQSAIELALTESLSNVIRHGFRTSGDGVIRIEADAEPVRMVVLIVHPGQPFSGQEAIRIEPREIDLGGLGLFLIQQSVDEVIYGQDDRGRQTICLTKSYLSGKGIQNDIVH